MIIRVEGRQQPGGGRFNESLISKSLVRGEGLRNRPVDVYAEDGEYSRQGGLIPNGRASSRPLAPRREYPRICHIF